MHSDDLALPGDGGDRLADIADPILRADAPLSLFISFQRAAGEYLADHPEIVDGELEVGLNRFDRIRVRVPDGRCFSLVLGVHERHPRFECRTSDDFVVDVWLEDGAGCPDLDSVERWRSRQ